MSGESGMQEHITEEQLVLHYYGDSGDSRAVDAHLAECALCREQFQTLQRVLNVAGSHAVPERPADYGDQVWRKLAPQIKTNRWKRWLRVRQWMPVAAAAALAIAAFLAGRYGPGRTESSPAIAQTGVRERVLLVAVGDHLERSQMVLVEIANAPEEGNLNITPEREMAETLLEANRLYRQTAASTGNASVASVLDDLERVLLEIAHGPSDLTGEQLRALRNRIEAQGLLFKVRVLGKQVEKQAEQPAGPAREATL